MGKLPPRDFALLSLKQWGLREQEHSCSLSSSGALSSGIMVLALSQAVGPRRRASAPRRRKKILAAMLWCLLNGYDDDDDAYLFQNAYQSYQEEENASLLRVVSLVELYERARRDKRWYQLSDLPTRRGCLWARIQSGGRPEAYANFLGLDINAFELLLTRYEEAYGSQFPRTSARGRKRTFSAVWVQ